MTEPAALGLEEVCSLTEARTGLRINGPDRASNLIRLEGARDSVGCADWMALAQRLQNEDLVDPTWVALIRALTIGETYFFRDKPQLDFLFLEALPDLIKERRKGDRHWLRLWSAGCATGEEAYTLALKVAELIPDRTGWAITILGTDLNPEAIRLARLGEFGRWSFRGGEAELIARHSTARGGRVVINPDIRSMVTFARHNLADEDPRGLHLSFMDIILCRNVTMYFDPKVRREIAQRMLAYLMPGGWLFAGSSEPDAQTYEGFGVVMSGGMTAYRRPELHIEMAGPVAVHAMEWPALPLDEPDLRATVKRVAAASPQPRKPARTMTLDELLGAARRAADAGRYAEARVWSGRALDLDPTAADAYELLGMIYASENDAERAVGAFRKALYLEHDFPAAYYGLSVELHALGDITGARHSVETARHLLRSVSAHTRLRGNSGLTAAELSELIGPDDEAVPA